MDKASLEGRRVTIIQRFDELNAQKEQIERELYQLKGKHDLITELLGESEESGNITETEGKSDGTEVNS